MPAEKALALLGLARRAGKVKSGEFSVEKDVKSGRAFLVVLAFDASDNTKKKFTDMCAYYKVPVVVSKAGKEELGRLLGTELRTSVSVEDEGFAKAILKSLEANKEQSYKNIKNRPGKE